MDCAIAQARRAAQLGEVPVGAVVVLAPENYCLAQAHNMMEAQNDPTAHAEMLAIQKACQLLKHKCLSLCDLYITLEPCLMCAQAVSLARLNKVFFGAYAPQEGNVVHERYLFQKKAIGYQPEIFGGFCESTCQALLKDFFTLLR